MADLVAKDVNRVFPSGGGVRGACFEVARGEFFVLLGPSGCGKSTLLRLIAGLDRPDSGEILVAGDRAGSDGVARDAVAMVFQSFALYPHMTAYENIAFPLRIRRLSREEIARRVAETARTAGLAISLSRYPAELSGGERQRVALARALVREPALILMDEPMASLDVQLRANLRTELREFQRRTGRTIIYVTHDQADALAMGDRLAVMRAGIIEQIGVPERVYERPASEFVASFLGEPAMNLIRAIIVPERDALVMGDLRLALTPPKGARNEVTIGIRPADFALEPQPDTIEIPAFIHAAEFAGRGFTIRAQAAGVGLTALVGSRVAEGDAVRLYVPRARIHFFDPSTGKRIE